MELLCPQWTPSKQSPGRMAHQHEENCKKGTAKSVLGILQREQAATKEVTIQQLEAGGVRKAKRRKVVQRKEKTNQHELLERETLTLMSQLLDTVVGFDF